MHSQGRMNIWSGRLNNWKVWLTRHSKDDLAELSDMALYLVKGEHGFNFNIIKFLPLIRFVLEIRKILSIFKVMNPKELIRTSLAHESFTISKHQLRRFLNVWHYHQELELVYIKKSTGTKFVGDCIEQFSEGDLVLIGSCLPHLWLNDKKYFERKDLIAEALVIHFHPYCFGKDFFNIPEMHKILKVMEEAKVGIRVNGANKDKIVERMEKILSGTDSDKVVSLLNIMQLIEAEPNKSFLSSHSFINAYAKNSSTKLDKVYEFVLNNFKQEINLNQIAELVHMNPSSFSRYFKQTTNKTFIQFVNEVRIGYACKILLDDGDKNVSEIAFECGYNNLSNFNKQFKLINGKTPRDYLTSHQQADFMAH